jgi:hypothetical protein
MSPEKSGQSVTTASALTGELKACIEKPGKIQKMPCSMPVSNEDDAWEAIANDD